MRQHERLPVQRERVPGLRQMVKADCEVVGVVRVAALEAISAEPGPLRLGPSRLGGVEVAQAEVQVCGLRLDPQQCLQTTLHARRIPLCDGDEGGAGGGVGGVGGEECRVVFRRLVLSAGLGRDCREPQPGVAVARLVSEHGPICLPGRFAVPGEVRPVGAFERLRDLIGVRALRDDDAGTGAGRHRNRLVPLSVRRVVPGGQCYRLRGCLRGRVSFTARCRGEHRDAFAVLRRRGAAGRIPAFGCFCRPVRADAIVRPRREDGGGIVRC